MSNATWYYANAGQQVGPIGQAEFDGLVANGTIRADTQVWHEGMANWQRYGDLAGAGTGGVRVATQTGGVVCSECGQTFPPDEVISYGGSWVCAACKPVFIQRLKEAGQVSINMDYAGFWIRVGAKIIDQILLQIAASLAGFVVGMGMSGNSPSESLARNVAATILGMLLSLVYSVWFLGKYGATPGKMVCGLKVVTAEGGPISYGRACGRFFAEILSGLILGIGYLMVAFDEEKRALHDRICNTRVVKK
jgi:uncharacterized RDD family membrane protein YckC